MKKYLKNPLETGRFEDEQGTRYALIEVVEGSPPSLVYETIEGNTREDAAARANLTFVGSPQVITPKTCPQRLTPRQLRLMLIKNNISLANIELAINQIPDEEQKQMALVEWEYTTFFDRQHPMVLSMAAQIGLTSEQVDEIFRQGFKL